MNRKELKAFLDEKVVQYNRPTFIQSDPIQVPHSFELKEDIEIMAFLSSIIAWGQRKTIIANANKLADAFGNSPYHFIVEADKSKWLDIPPFKHRTFNHVDLLYFLKALRNIYTDYGGLEKAFSNGKTQAERISNFRNLFLSFQSPDRTSKHIANPMKGSSAKRLNMFLRWMVRDSSNGIDFGIWKSISASELMIPLDVHTGNVSRALGLLKRKQNDWKAVEELSQNLKKLDPRDPIKYDLALFSLGVFESFGKEA